MNIQLETNNSLIPFGKYKDKTVGEVLKINPNYLKWMKEKCGNVTLSRHILIELKHRLYTMNDHKPSNTYRSRFNNDYLVTGDPQIDFDLSLCGQ